VWRCHYVTNTTFEWSLYRWKETDMSARITVTFDSGKVLELPNVPISEGKLSREVLLQKLPATSRLTSAIQEDPDTAIKLLNDYQAGRMDAVHESALRLGAIDSRSTADPQPQAIIIIIIIIIIILAFPPSAK